MPTMGNGLMNRPMQQGMMGIPPQVLLALYLQSMQNMPSPMMPQAPIVERRQRPVIKKRKKKGVTRRASQAVLPRAPESDIPKSMPSTSSGKSVDKNPKIEKDIPTPVESSEKNMIGSGLMGMDLREIKEMLGPGVSINRKRRKIRKKMRRRQNLSATEIASGITTEGGSHLVTEGGSHIQPG